MRQARASQNISGDAMRHDALSEMTELTKVLEPQEFPSYPWTLDPMSAAESKLQPKTNTHMTVDLTTAFS